MNKTQESLIHLPSRGSVTLRWFCSFMLLMGFVAVTQAAELKTLNFSELPGNKAKIELLFSEPVAKPNGFSTDDPARIVLDFIGVQNRLDEKTQTVNIGVTRSIATVEAGERTRMVINLLKKVPYTVTQSGNKMSITLDTAAVVSSTTIAPSTQVMSSTSTTAIENIDFRRGEAGEARVIVKLNGDEAAMDVRQMDGDILVELANVELPDKLHRRLDVIDFATPVTFVDAETKGSSTLLRITTQGKFEHMAYQSDNTLVVEVKPLADTAEDEKKQNEFGYSGEKLSLNFQNIEVRAVLQLLADFTGLNLVTSDTVTGNLTLRLKNVPWDQALDIILKTKGLAKRLKGDVMLVAPAAEIAAREKQELEAQKQLIELEPLYMEIIEIKFAKADALAELLRADDSSGNRQSTANSDSGFLSPRGSITIDPRTNSLLIRDTADQLVQIRQLIEDLDRPVRQVLIESRIVIANDDFNKELGVRFGISSDSDSNGSLLNNGALSGSLNDISNNGSDLSPSGNLGAPDVNSSVITNQGLNVNMPVTSPSGSIGLALAKLPLGTILQLELSAMQAEGKGEVISSPRVITSNQQQATIEQGTEIPYQEATSSGATNVSFKEAVLKLDVTPQITPDDRIIMDLEVSKDEVGEVYLGVPSIDTRSVKTQVLIDNGETVVLGGIYEQSKSDTIERVPFFGDLPYVGFLFRNTTRENDKQELLVFVTPKIVKEGVQY